MEGFNDDRSSSPSILWNRLVLSILITETAERIAYFGFRAVLVLYFTHGLRFSESIAVSLCSATVALSYFSPLVGAVLADSSWGRFQTIWRFGCLYAGGLFLLTWAAFGVSNYQAGDKDEEPERLPQNLVLERTLTFIGLFCACMGTGGIKPCVSAFGADQVVLDCGGETAKTNEKDTFEDDIHEPTADHRQERLREFFNSFYFAINVGALGSFALIPVVRARYGFGASFLIPTISMILALIVFRSQKADYKHRIRDEAQHSLLDVFVASFAILRDRLRNSTVGMIWCGHHAIRHEQVPTEDDDGRDGHHIQEAGEDNCHTTPVSRDASQALHLLPLMAFFPIFWMLYDQQGSVWTLQATRMNLHGFQPEQLQFLNPLEIMIFIPLFDKIIYPWMEQRSVNILPVGRMEYGMFLTAVSFVVSTILEQTIRNRPVLSVSVAWQVPQITILTIAEILLNVTGLEFAYSQAPPNMQAFILSLYLFMTAIGNGLGALLYGSVFSNLSTATALLVCAVCMFLNMICFAVVARRWKPFRHTTALDSGLELGPVHNKEHQH